VSKIYFFSVTRSSSVVGEIREIRGGREFDVYDAHSIGF
jgi:hypothetical protein